MLFKTHLAPTITDELRLLTFLGKDNCLSKKLLFVISLYLLSSKEYTHTAT